MPKTNCIGVLSRITLYVRTMKIPVVVLTFPKEDPDIQECYDLEVNDCVAEPIQFDEFHKAVYALGLYRMKVNQPP